MACSKLMRAIAPRWMVGIQALSTAFVPITTDRELWAGHSTLPRHRHEHGYACLVLSGSYEEAGDCGRRVVRAGDVICHGPFDAHRDRMSAAGAMTINITLSDWTEFPADLCRVPDPDAIARLAEHDHDEARALLLSTMQPVHSVAMDWPDLLADDIRRQPHLSLLEWAETRGLAPATVSRGFRRIYEITCAAFRAQLRARRAWRALVHGVQPLCVVAQESGFADQAHMTRSVIALTGRSPSLWRRLGSNGFNTHGARRCTLHA